MYAELFSVCHSAKQNPAGNFDVVGIYNSQPIQIFPSIVQNLTVAARVRFDPGEQGNHDFEIAILNPRGQLCGPPAAGTFIAQPDSGHQFSWKQITIVIPTFQYIQPGVHSLRLTIDKQLVATCILSVIQADLAPPAPKGL
jgi:hypothetical protein